MEIKLKAEKREKGEKLAGNFMAAILYGPNIENESLKVKSNDFAKVYSLAGESNLIKLEVAGKSENILVKEVQRHPTKGFFTHADLYQVDMSRVITTEIPLNYVGGSKAVKEMGGLLIKNLNEVSVECLPKDLVASIDIDISFLDSLGKTIFIRDLNIPSGLKVMNNIDDSVVSVVEPKEEVVAEEVKSTEGGDDDTKESAKEGGKGGGESDNKGQSKDAEKKE